MGEEILRKTRRQIRSIVDLCEEFGDRRLVQNLPPRTIFTLGRQNHAARHSKSSSCRLTPCAYR